MFDAKELTAALNAGQIKIPDDHRVALVIHLDPITQNATATVAVRFGKSWELGNTMEWDKEDGLRDGFNLSFSK